MIDPKVWKEQQEFNAVLRPWAEHAMSEDKRAELTKDFALHMISEITEMLDAMGTWQSHRRQRFTFTNDENVRRQLVDQFKYWITICQLWGFTPDLMADTYWRKSATVRQRYAEEFLVKLDRPAVILDLDNVLADYTNGFCDWVIRAVLELPMDPRDTEGNHLGLGEFTNRVNAMRDKRQFFSAQNAGVDLVDWMRLQHQFRAQGGFARLPPMPHLAELMAWLQYKNYCVIGLTSRSIESYGNIIDDTLSWLTTHGVRMDCVWWGPHKGEKLKDSFPHMHLIEFVVDDDPRYLQQYVNLGMKRIYWMKEGMEGAVEPHPSIIPVSTLADIVALEQERAHGDQR